MTISTVHQHEIEKAIRSAGLSGSAVCLHSSLHSFGYVAGGAVAVVQAFLNEGCTLLAPTFSWGFAVSPPADQQISRNGWDYVHYPGPTAGIGRIYTTASREIDADMGAIPAALLHHSEVVRGDHPICSFSAAGPLAGQLISTQRPDDAFAPLAALAGVGGYVVLAGVSLDKLTLLHLAEKEAGRTLFRRFANDRAGRTVAVEVGGCSDGFERLGELLWPLSQVVTVGQSEWRILPAQETLRRAVAAIQLDPQITHCGRKDCDRCNDAVLGGPQL